MNFCLFWKKYLSSVPFYIQDPSKAGKTSEKQAAKYDSFQPKEKRYLVNLWNGTNTEEVYHDFNVIDTLCRLSNSLVLSSESTIAKFQNLVATNLSRFLVEPNKFCQPSATGP